MFGLIKFLYFLCLFNFLIECLFKGSSQWIHITFVEEQNVGGFQLQFQGGFNAACLLLKFVTSDGPYEESFDLEDTNAEQSFQLKNVQKNVKSIRFILTQCSDFFGRIILYKLNVHS